MIVKNKEDFIRKIEGDKFIFIGGEYENQHSKFHIKDNEGYEYLVSPYWEFNDNGYINILNK